MGDTDPARGRRPPHTPQLRELQRRTAAYLEFLRDVDQWAEQAADVNRLANPPYAGLLDRLRDELRAARNDHEMGTPTMIARVVGELLGEEP